ncbi:hypothetical protein KM043_017218 [Ampulex compressa]|nr:hypothetical protein KM043_017218 [Ampulex compressa]
MKNPVDRNICSEERRLMLHSRDRVAPLQGSPSTVVKGRTPEPISDGDYVEKKHERRRILAGEDASLKSGHLKQDDKLPEQPPDN